MGNIIIWKRRFLQSLKNVRYYYADYTHAKIVSKDFEIKNLGENYHLHVQSDKLLLSVVFDNFRKRFLKMHEFDPAKFFSAPGLAWQATLKKLK